MSIHQAYEKNVGKERVLSDISEICASMTFRVMSHLIVFRGLKLILNPVVACFLQPPLLMDAYILYFLITITIRIIIMLLQFC